MKVLVTGSNGLIGSEAVEYYDKRGHTIIGVDNNMRAQFLGPKGDTIWNLNRLKKTIKQYSHYDVDIRDRTKIFDIFKEHRFDLVIHCAAQPSHDKAKDFPLLDFEVNALGTINVLEAMRQFCPEAVFIHMSTNKVYGDVPNNLPLKELETRYDYSRPEDHEGITEECCIDRCQHSLFGASKVSADIMAQEYGRYYGLKIGIFRAGCLTGPFHSSVKDHGFLNYLVKVAISGEVYTVFGYKGKQVRDNIHSYDLVESFEVFRRNPKKGEVFNIGGGRRNSISVLEAIVKIEQLSGRKIKWQYSEENRIGDHICYISDLRKFRQHYPQSDITKSLDDILTEMIRVEMGR